MTRLTQPAPRLPRRAQRAFRKKQLKEFTGLSDTQIDEEIARGELSPGTLINEGGRARIWYEDEIVEYQDRKRAKAAPAPWLAKRLREAGK